MNGVPTRPVPVNEPVRTYAPGTADRAALEAELRRQAGLIIDIPCVVGDEEILTGNVWELRDPCDHDLVLARVHLPDPELVDCAIESSLEAQADWANLPQHLRSGVFLAAAEDLAGPSRYLVNAATMLGQGKSPYEAEIDAACELIDFWRFNVHYAGQITEEQPPVQPGPVWNMTDHRPLEGFVYAVSPFNFTSIAANLPSAPAMVGNVALWKPSLESALSSWYLFQIMRRAGLPPGVINFIPGHGPEVSAAALGNPALAGLHFTGSTATFQSLYGTIAGNLGRYATYPRIVGETGGKDFIVAHPSFDLMAFVTAVVTGGFGYQGQKCSAASRVYAPASRRVEILEALSGMTRELSVGDVRTMRNYMGAVINERALTKHASYLGRARGHLDCSILVGGSTDSSQGWFVDPTIVVVTDPQYELMTDELFGPIVSIYFYDDGGPDAWSGVLKLVDTTSPYALTGSVFAQDPQAIDQALRTLRNAAGNFYINNRPTGAVVGQQPFGGARASGTNDKAGAHGNLLRWLSPRTVMRNLLPPRQWRPPFLG